MVKTFLKKIISLTNPKDLKINFIFRLGKGIERIQSVQIDTERKRSAVEDAGKRNLVIPTGQK